MQNVYIQNIKISCYDTDCRCRLRPSSFMDLAQEAAQRHANILGFGYDDLMRTKTVWVLSRIHFRFLKDPHWRDEVTLSTWHKGPEGLFYLRDFRLTDKDGEDAVLATSSWLVLNVDTRHIVRDACIMDNRTSGPGHAIEKSCDKVKIPAGAAETPAGEHKVVYSDVDMNGHTNNANYLKWVMDTFDFEFIANNPVREVSLNFNSETHPGDVVKLYRADLNGKMFFEGRADGKSAFTAELVV